MLKNGYIMSGDKKVALIENGNVTPIEKDLMPVYLQKRNDIEGWLQGRAIDKHRTNSRLLKKALRLTSSDDVETVLKVHGATITDNYWYKEVDSKLCYEDVKFKENLFDQLALCGDPDSFNQKADSTPELTNIGSYEKCWKLVDGQWWMYKQGNENERFSELFISLLGKELGFNMAHYELDDKYIKSLDYTKHASVNYEPMHSYVCEDEAYQKSFEILYELNPEAAKDFVNMIYLDTICFNMDRHTKNYGVLRDVETGKVIGLAPNFDNNIALISRGYPKNIERFDDILIGLFTTFVSNNEIAYKFYDEIKTEILCEELIYQLIEQTGFDVDKEHISTFILTGAQRIVDIIMDQYQNQDIEMQ